TLGDDLQTGIDWVQRGRSPVEKGTGHYRYTDGAGNVITSPDLGESFTRTTTDADGDETETKWTRIGEELTKMVPIRDTFLNRSHYGLGGGGGDSSELLATIVGQGMNIASNANPIGTGINYILKSDRLNLAAVIQASKTDSRTKYIASPIVMTVDNKEATIDATENRQFLTGWQAQSSGVNGSGQPTPNYSSKDIGIKIKITPKINPNGTVMLTLQEEYSQFVRDGQSMLIPVAGQTYRPGTVDLAVERKLEADILLENMQTVVLGGLTETYNSESETGIPILKDIPWIGKWLFGSVTQTENRKELLIFLTPYVLDEGDAAQAEAIRRKKALSDPRPWDDHGWSLSELADPVSKKEQLRRFKDEWAKQDEERKTKLAIEKAKLERAEKLKSMSAEERKMWLELHEKELEDEQQEELREKMLDEESQEELKELADRIRTEKLGEAETALEENDAKMHAENERGKYDRENAQ
ncbi:MAG: hypothetical protein ILO34_01335, partial [Kiritimatiellae bacterium]|nr:hypothetical protein [Kiritimatiellia bacterium]